MTDQDTPYVYDVYGLKVHSFYKLPEIRPAVTGTAITESSVWIRPGAVPFDLEDGERVSEYMEVGKDCCLYTFDGVGRFLIRNGLEIVVDAESSSAEVAIRAYIIGSGLGTLLHQRKKLPLHVSSVLTPSGVVAFTGHSGAGKSTMAGLLNKETGWPLISDDLAVLDPAKTQLQLNGGVIRLKLWKDAVQLLGSETEDLSQDFARIDKYHLHAPRMFTDEMHELRHLIMLQPSEDMRMERIEHGRAFELMMTAIYRPELVRYFNDPAAVFSKCADAARQIEVSIFHRVWSQVGLIDSVNFLAEYFDTSKK
tara:strand:+ start:56503 stop:57432 length:930 start_codon:yes stop_codon:yes gene_type:complete